MTTLRENEQAGGERVKPRLLVLASTYPRWLGDHEPGFVHELAKRLTDCFEVTVLCPHSAGAKELEELDGVSVVRYRYAPASLECLVNDGGIVANLRRHRYAYLFVPSFVLMQAWMLLRLTRRKRPDVIHAHWLIPQGLLVAVLRALGLGMPPFLVTSHGADLFALKGKLMDKLKRFVLRRAAIVTVVSGSMKTEIQRLDAATRAVRVEPMGVDLVERFRPDPMVQRSSSELLFVGRLVEKKGLCHLLDAMPSILAQRPDVTLTVAGFGPEESERREQVLRLGISDSVSFLGAVPQSELPDVYRRGAMLVAPFVRAASGDQEGLGLVMVEALGCGCPVVVSDLPATWELGADTAGLVRIPAGDAAAISAAVLSLLATPLMVPDGVMAKFDWIQRARAYSQHLSDAARTGSIGRH